MRVPRAPYGSFGILPPTLIECEAPVALEAAIHIMKDHSMKKNLAAYLLAGLLSLSAQASPLNVTFSGTWWAQANTVIGGAQQVPISVPVNFSISMIIDPNINSFETFVINANYLTRFPSVEVSSSATAYGLPNPFGPTYASGSYASVSRYSASYAPYRIESQNFGYRELSGTTFSDGGTGEWQLQLRINSPNIGVDVVRPINAADLVASLNAAQLEQRQFSIYYEKSATVSNTSAITGYPYSGYIGGIALNGYAVISSVRPVPEPTQYAMLVGGLLVLLSIKRRKVKSRRSQ